jgi:hypothetical protein
MTVHHCVRVYANGDARETVRDEEGLESWLTYNRQARGGNALFVDGVCAETDRGYLSVDHVRRIEVLLQAELPGRSSEQAVRKSAGRYPDDRLRVGFRLLDAKVEAKALSPLAGILEEGWGVPDDEVLLVPGPIFGR